MATTRERKGISVVSNLLSGNIGEINKKSQEKTTDNDVNLNNIKNEILSNYSFSFEIDKDTEQFLKEQTFKLHTVNNKMNTELGQIFKETQDLLAKNGYGCFKNWFEELGFKKDTVYRYIGRYNLIVALGDKQKVELVEALPIKLAYEISKEDCPQNLKEKVLNGEITSLTNFLEQKKLELSHMEVLEIIESEKDYLTIFENDFKTFNNNYNNLNIVLKEKLPEFSIDKQKLITEELELLNKKIEKLLRSL